MVEIADAIAYFSIIDFDCRVTVIYINKLTVQLTLTVSLNTSRLDHSYTMNIILGCPGIEHYPTG
jgi:hypothetical protein